MTTKIIIVLEIEGSAETAHEVVEGALDAGVLQDWLTGYEHDGPPFTIVSATSRADALDDVGPTPLPEPVPHASPCPVRAGWGYFNDREVQRDDEAALFETDDDARAHIRGCSFCLMDLMVEADGLPVETMLSPPEQAGDDEATS